MAFLSWSLRYFESLPRRCSGLEQGTIDTKRSEHIRIDAIVSVIGSLTFKKLSLQDEDQFLH